MSKHTPGPWAYRPSNSGHFIAGAGENSGYLAEVRHCRSNQDAKADARLIAAAPEMLQMLIYCRDWLQGSEPHRARAVSECIAKATGEAA